MTAFSFQGSGNKIATKTRKYIHIVRVTHAITILSLVRKTLDLYFFNAMNTRWNVAVLLYTPLVFECFVKRKNFVSTKCKQKIYAIYGLKYQSILARVAPRYHPRGPGPIKGEISVSSIFNFGTL